MNPGKQCFSLIMQFLWIENTPAHSASVTNILLVLGCLYLLNRKIKNKNRKTSILRNNAAITFIIYFTYRLLSILQCIISNWWKFFLGTNKVSLTAISAIFRNLWKIFFLLMPESVTSSFTVQLSWLFNITITVNSSKQATLSTKKPQKCI